MVKKYINDHLNNPIKYKGKKNIYFFLPVFFKTFIACSIASHGAGKSRNTASAMFSC
jgi:hypothetical protein